MTRRAWTHEELAILSDIASRHPCAADGLREIDARRLLSGRTESAIKSALGKTYRRRAAASRAAERGQVEPTDTRAMLRALLVRHKLLLDSDRVKYGAWARLRRRHRDWPDSARTALCAIWRQGWAPQCWERRLELALRGLA